ncbi:protein scai [Holotrichia oblita]|uniref:Protein scai n=1 Tax=Holotrichia oblita TaxID=644536 RepID=A0ACB9TYK0_HOLOL|nr:protein scai [Holotrichia oblita]
MKLVRDLIVELDRHIADYTSTYEPEDQYEWTMVLDEIRAFIEADSLVSVLHADTNPIVLSHRLSPLTTPPVEKSPFMTLTLQEILIVGSSSDQVKFSELTMDMFRMIQTLEREPQDDYNHIYDASPAPGRVPYGMPGTKALWKTGKDRLDEKIPINIFLGYDLGGVLTSSKREGEHKKQKEAHCLYPGDLYPFTRRPLFVIVDSDNSFVFQHIPRYFGQPLVTLMSPQDIPPAFHDQQHNGSLFTLFLHSPLTAFCYCCNLTSIPIHHWERCQSFVDRFVTEASRLFTRSQVGEYDEVYTYYVTFVWHLGGAISPYARISVCHTTASLNSPTWDLELMSTISV